MRSRTNEVRLFCRKVTTLSWINIVPESDATGVLARIYAESRAKFGRVINLVKIQSLRPETMALRRQRLLWRVTGLWTESLCVLGSQAIESGDRA